MTADWLSPAAEFKAKPKQAKPYTWIPGNQYRRRCRSPRADCPDADPAVEG